MLPPPSTIVALDPEEFLSASQYAGMVAENEFLEEIPGLAKSRITTPGGTFRFSNDPFILFGFAVRRYFRNEPDKFTAFMRRFFGLRPLLHHNEMKPYLKGAGGELEVHHAVFEVAATEKLLDGYEFERKSFFQRVREVAARMEIDEANALKKSCNGNEQSSKE
jgi:hypothetical protein